MKKPAQGGLEGDSLMCLEREMPLPTYIHKSSILGDGWLWLCIPKNASRSLVSILMPVGTIWHDGQDVRGPVHTFAFIRDPIDRIASVWRNKIRDRADRRFFDCARGIRADMTLDEFVAFLPGRLTKNPHWLPQSRFLRGADGNMVVQTIAPIHAVDTVLSDLGLPVPAPRINASKPGEEMSPTSRSLLEQLYKDDVALWERYGA